MDDYNSGDLDKDTAHDELKSIEDRLGDLYDYYKSNEMNDEATKVLGIIIDVGSFTWHMVSNNSFSTVKNGNTYEDAEEFRKSLK